MHLVVKQNVGSNSFVARQNVGSNSFVVRQNVGSNSFVQRTANLFALYDKQGLLSNNSNPNLHARRKTPLQVFISFSQVNDITW